jgi:conjugative transfer signal peptidase TraF
MPMKSICVVRALRLYALAAFVVVAAFAAGCAIELTGHALIVNVSPSMPIGVYWITRGTASVAHGSIVWFVPPERVQALIYGRGWLPNGTLLLKTVGGLAGDTYCVRNGRFVVDGVDGGPVFLLDSQGLPVPQIVGCRRVGEGEFLPVATILARSFDGRYMGAVPLQNVLGTARALVTF